MMHRNSNKCDSAVPAYGPVGLALFLCLFGFASALEDVAPNTAGHPGSLNETELVLTEGINARFPLEPKAFAECHNITGTCLSHGFVCASDQVVPHSKRCDGVEDCRDGTDEFMCEHDLRTPLAEASHEARHAHEQMGCVNCNCRATTITITQTMGWFQFARLAPVDYLGLATGAINGYGGRPCNPVCVTSIQMTFYRKNGVCRGWLCCARQNQCMACRQNTAPSCPGLLSPIYTKRCYIV